jgi:hypothetical protein
MGRYTVEILEARIKELEDGSCRFNCRSMKEAFIDGWYAGTEYSHDRWMEQESSIAASQAYKQWLKDQRAEKD